MIEKEAQIKYKDWADVYVADGHVFRVFHENGMRGANQQIPPVQHSAQ